MSIKMADRISRALDDCFDEDGLCVASKNELRDAILDVLKDPDHDMIEAAYEASSISDHWNIEDADDFMRAFKAAIESARTVE